MMQLLYTLALAALVMLVSGLETRNKRGVLQQGTHAMSAVLPKSHIRYRARSEKERTHFHIVSHLNGYVMDVLNRDRRPGAHVIMWSKKEMSRSNQVWYQEANGMIRSQMNGLCIDIGDDGYAFMNYCHEHAPMQKWAFNDKMIQNRVNASLILDISFYNRNLGARVAAWTYHNGLNQHWYTTYAGDI